MRSATPIKARPMQALVSFSALQRITLLVFAAVLAGILGG
jgi:hypothetical protein